MKNLKSSYLERFALTSRYGVMYPTKDGVAYAMQAGPRDPAELWAFHAVKRIMGDTAAPVFNIVGAKESKTKLMLFDVDDHHCTFRGDTRQIAWDIHNILNDYRIPNELAESSTPSCYHVTAVSARPQSCQYVYIVQNMLLKELGYQDCKAIELFPGEGGLKAIRPWMFGNWYKKPGKCVAEGEIVPDFKPLLKFYCPTKRKIINTQKASRQVDINKWVPRERGTRHNCLMGMVLDSYFAGCSLDETLAHAEVIWNLGVRGTSLKQHLLEARSCFNAMGKKSKGGMGIRAFLDTLPKLLPDIDVFQRLQDKYGDFFLSSPDFAYYIGKTQQGACKRLAKAVKRGQLQVVCPGKRHHYGKDGTLEGGVATQYRVQGVGIQPPIGSLVSLYNHPSRFGTWEWFYGD